MKPNSKRRRLSKQAWAAVMRRFEGTGTPVSEFCAREGLNTASFYRWRTRLGSTGDVQPCAGAVKPQSLPEHPGAAAFIELGSMAGPARDASASLELRLDLGGGLVLQIARR